MAGPTAARVETKIQVLVLGPLWVCFIVGALISAYFAAWWVAAVHVLLSFYIGWIGKNLGIHANKSFSALSKGVDAEIPAPVTDEAPDLSSVESLRIGLTVNHILYAITIAAGTLSLVGGLGYWTILIGIGVFMLGRGCLFAVTGLILAAAIRSAQAER